MFQPRSIALQTELNFAEMDGLIKDCGEYLCVQTPSNFNFFWGNYLLFANPPESNDLKRWPELFRENFGERCHHQTFVWDSPEGHWGVATQFESSGFRLDLSVSLLLESAQKLRQPLPLNTAIIVRPLLNDTDWQQAEQNHLASLGGTGPNMTEKQEFYRWLFGRYRRLSKRGCGFSYGAFLGDKLVASMGIFARNGLARFQEVVTHPAHRRQRICRSMAHQAVQHFTSEKGAHQFVTVADEDGEAIGAYKALGFKQAQRQQGLCWYDPLIWPS